MSFCTACGQQLGHGARFCGGCGAPVDASTTSAAPQSATQGDEQGVFDLVGILRNGDRTWANAFEPMISSDAQDWFCATVSTGSLLGKMDADLGRVLADQHAPEAEWVLADSFVMLPHGSSTGSVMNPRIDDWIMWQQSSNARRIEVAYQASGFMLGPTPGGEGQVGWWPTASGGTSIQFCQIMRAHDGSEYLWWHTTPLVSSGAVPDNDAARIALVASIPHLLQTIVYLAEAPAPTMPDLVARDGGRAQLLYGITVDARRAPLPVASLSVPAPGETVWFFAQAEPGGPIQPYVSGATITLGYAIPVDADDAALARSIEVAVRTLLRVTDVLEDGFLNHRQGEWAFDRALLSQADIVEGSTQRWVPPSRACDLAEQWTVVS